MHSELLWCDTGARLPTVVNEVVAFQSRRREGAQVRDEDSYKHLVGHVCDTGSVRLQRNTGSCQYARLPYGSVPYAGVFSDIVIYMQKNCMQLCTLPRLPGYRPRILRAPDRLAGNTRSRKSCQLPRRLRLPRLPPSHLCASTSRS